MKGNERNERSGGAIDFSDKLLDLPLIYLSTDNFSLRITQILTFYYNYKKEEVTDLEI